MNKKDKIKWVEPRIVNLEQLPTTLGACESGASAPTGGCSTGSSATGGGLGGGTMKCNVGSSAGKNQCVNGNTQV